MLLFDLSTYLLVIVSHHASSAFFFLHHFKVQAHGSDAMVDEENCVFFLPHRPRSEIAELPFFLFMKGTGNAKKRFLYMWLFILHNFVVVVCLLFAPSFKVLNV